MSIKRLRARVRMCVHVYERCACKYLMQVNSVGRDMKEGRSGTVIHSTDNFHNLHERQNCTVGGGRRGVD